MDEKLAETLLDGLENHPEIHSNIIGLVNKQLFLDVLVNRKIPQSLSKWNYSLPKEEQILQNGSLHYKLSLRKILRNYNGVYKATDYYIPPEKRLLDFADAHLRPKSPNLVRQLRADEDLLKMMAESGHEFSLLGMLKTYDYKKTLYVITKPILVIPGAKDISKVSAWEQEHTVYEKEVGILFRYLKRIKPSEYLLQ